MEERNFQHLCSRVVTPAFSRRQVSRRVSAENTILTKTYVLRLHVHHSIPQSLSQYLVSLTFHWFRRPTWSPCSARASTAPPQTCRRPSAPTPAASGAPLQAPPRVLLQPLATGRPPPMAPQRRRHRRCSIRCCSATASRSWMLPSANLNLDQLHWAAVTVRASPCRRPAAL